MTRSAKVEALFGGEVREFRLTIGHLEELQERCNAGPETIFNRIVSGDWRVADIVHTIRLGLMGGGASSTDASILVKRYCEAGEIGYNKVLAQSIIGAAIIGAPDEDAAPGETEGETKPSPVANGASDGFMKSEGP